MSRKNLTLPVRVSIAIALAEMCPDTEMSARANKLADESLQILSFTEESGLAAHTKIIESLSDVISGLCNEICKAEKISIFEVAKRCRAKMESAGLPIPDALEF